MLMLSSDKIGISRYVIRFIILSLALDGTEAIVASRAGSPSASVLLVLLLVLLFGQVLGRSHRKVVWRVTILLFLAMSFKIVVQMGGLYLSSNFI